MTRRGVVATGLASVAVAAAAIGETIRHGFGRASADDATYLFVGRTVLDGHLPRSITGGFYALRSPVWGVTLAAADHVRGSGPFAGARVIATVIAAAVLVLAVVLGARLGGGGTAVAVAVALLATPAVWVCIPSLFVDVPLTLAVLATIFAFRKATVSRALLAGALFGMAVLVKETSGLLVFLPLAWLGAVPRRVWWRLAASYVGAAALIAAWWWVMVWVQTHEIFPAAGVNATEDRATPRAFSVSVSGWVWVAVLAAGAVAFAWSRRRDPQARLVTVALLALFPPALYSWIQELAIRNFFPLAVLAGVAAGVTGAALVAALWARDSVVRIAVAAATAIIVLGACATQVHTERRPRGSSTSTDLGDWLVANSPDGSRVVMTFRARSETGFRAYGHVDMARLGFDESPDVPDLDASAWIGVVDGKLLALPKSRLVDALTHPDARYLVLSGPHRLAVPALLPTLRAGIPGLTEVVAFAEYGEYAIVFAVDPAQVSEGVGALRPHLTDEAALAWLDVAAERWGEEEAVQRFVAARPVVMVTKPRTKVELVGRLRPDGAAAVTFRSSP